MCEQIMEDRSKLPISSFKDVITSTLDDHQVSFFFPERFLTFGSYIFKSAILQRQ